MNPLKLGKLTKKDNVNTGNHKVVKPFKIKIEPYNPDGYK